MDQTGTAGVLASMNHPETYENGAQCRWNIRVPSGKRVHLHFESFSLEESQMCISDSVSISDHLSPLGMWGVGELRMFIYYICVNEISVRKF